MKQPSSDLYRDSLSLLTDLYELTMAYSYWKTGTADKEAVFNLSFRSNPFRGGFAIACGLSHLIEYIQNAKFTRQDIEYLGSLKGNDGLDLFDKEFLEYLFALKFECDIDAVAEGSVVFAHEPIVRVKGPIVSCQILESALLNIVNFQTLIATKAARLRLAAGDKAILEFGLRRAQGVDGSVSATWASYIGGCDGTSNVLAGKLYDIPVKGTHAHSWVMSYDDELEAFQAYAKAMPNNSVFLVDTYDSLAGVANAITTGKWLKENGYKFQGIRLDSGDFAYLSIEARKMLNEAGFADAKIFASNDLDEHIIQSLNDQGAQVDVWAVGTKLVTAYDQPSLGGVYKLTAVRKPGQDWHYKVKLSEQAVKISNPGIQQVRRFYTEDRNGKLFIGDMIFDEAGSAPESSVIVDPIDFTRRKVIPQNSSYVDLLKPIFRKGKLVYESPSAEQIREYSKSELKMLHPGIKRLLNPHQYPVGLELSLHQLKTELIMVARAERDKRAKSGAATTQPYFD
ncbi:MAG TPA: nicotinate phosphoribosyltransferase [Drouetiella sp.]